MLAGLGGLVGGSWVHQLHDLSLPLLGFGWVSLAAAHGWNRFRHGGGGLPWVMSILWLSTWVMLGSSIVVGLEERLLGHEEEVGGINWPHLVQQGLTWTFLALLIANVALAVGWWRFDLAGVAARLLPNWRRQTARAVAQLINLTAGVALAAAVGIIVVNLS